MRTKHEKELLERIALVQFIKRYEPRFRNCFLGEFTMEELLALETEIEQKLANKKTKPPRT